MELLVLFSIGLLIAIIVLPFVALAKVNSTKRIIDGLATRLSSLEDQVHSLQTVPVSKPEPTVAVVKAVASSPPITTPAPVVQEEKSVPPPIPEKFIKSSVPEITRPPKPSINWEQFMGAKLFAWIGGFALFLGVAFFVKYSFEHNLISPEMRVAIGFVVGASLVIGGLLLKRKENAVTAQTLCATGILVLYAVTFACRAYYHFAFFGLIPTFLLMTLITAIAFLLAVRLNAMVVAVLGIAGGFLTPVLLSTGEDHPLGLFVYIALLDVGLLAVAQRQRWNALPILGAFGTALMQLAWITTFFTAEKYFAGNKILVVMAVFAGFQGLFLAAAAWAKRTGQTNRELLACALGLAGAAILSAFYLLSFPTIAHRPVVLFSYVFILDLGVLALALLENRLTIANGLAGLAVFIFLAAWTNFYLTTRYLYIALTFYFVFALFHSATPLVLQPVRKIQVPWWSQAFPALSLLLMLMPIFQITELSLAVWPFVLIVDLLAFGLVLATGRLLPILAMLLLSLVAIGGWLLRIPSELTGLPTALFILAGFATFFLVAAGWAGGHFGVTKTGAPKFFGNITDSANLSVQLPALSAAMPFLLLIMVTVRLPLVNPSPVFCLALLLIILLLAMSERLSLDLLPVVGLACVLALEHAWHFEHFNPSNPSRAAIPLIWYLGFYAVFMVFPFIFHRKFAGKTAPWIAAALAGPLNFYLVYDLVRNAYPSRFPGLVPLAFALPSLLGLLILLKGTPLTSPARNAQLALFGGATLFFITLIFPIQFDRQWITVGWALEGAALCWLFRRVPHPGLRLTGVFLLVIVFARLALNPAVLSYHPRAAFPMLNWYLYAYGIATVCLFAAGRFLAPPRNLVLGSNVRPLLYTLGTVLAFLLVNIEIADYFSTSGTVALTFQFSGNFARDMSYSIAWALFALLMLIVGIRKQIAPVRYASLGLLGLTVLKLFFHDLSQLDQLYRISAFVAVAIIAMIASFLYQRFLGAAEKATETKSTLTSAP
jgi:Predicted membrane protein